MHRRASRAERWRRALRISRSGSIPLEGKSGEARRSLTRQRGTATGRSPRERRDSEARFYSTAWDSDRTLSSRASGQRSTLLLDSVGQREDRSRIEQTRTPPRLLATAFPALETVVQISVLG